MDDEALIRWTLRERLTAAGFDVVEAKNGHEALDLASARPVHVVLLDLAMPGMSGLEVLRSLKANDPTCPVIMMTAYGSPEDAEEAARLGVARFVSKPFDVPELVDFARGVARSRT